MSINTVEDETSYMNVGQQQNFEYMSMEMGNLEYSSWTQYPDYYKFFSVHVQLDHDVVHTERVTYDVL